MNLNEAKELTKEHFDTIVKAFFNDTVTINYSDTETIIPQAFPSFRAIQYFESSFDYYYHFYQFLSRKLDFIELKIIDLKLPKLDLTNEILSVNFCKQIPISASYNPTYKLYVYTLITHLFSFLHECGHLNIKIAEENQNKDTNHFEEYNCDYFSISKILHYFFTMKKMEPDNYLKMISEFKGEKNLFKTIIITSLMIFYLECISKDEIIDTQDHPSVQKRFCHMIYKISQQLEENFSFLFVSTTISKFLTEISRSLGFIERNLFNHEDIQFDNLLNYCVQETTFADIQTIMTTSLRFEKFNE